jgi:hypothetical protein
MAPLRLAVRTPTPAAIRILVSGRDALRPYGLIRLYMFARSQVTSAASMHLSRRTTTRTDRGRLRTNRFAINACITIYKSIEVNSP